MSILLHNITERVKKMIYPNIFAQQFQFLQSNPNNLSAPTRSSKVILPLHSAIARQIEQNSHYSTISLKEGKEYNYWGVYGSKKVDIAIMNDNKIVGAILFKGIRSSYNKNANNFIENMRGESTLFVDSGTPLYQIIFLPTQILLPNQKVEHPSFNSIQHYRDFLSYKETSSYWNRLKIGVYYIDISYEDYTGKYSSIIMPSVEPTLTEGINNFIMEIQKYE